MSRFSVIALAVSFIAIGYFSFRAYEFTETPEFCNLCHGVELLYETWFHSAHRPFTNCQSCHIPQDIRGIYHTLRYGIRDIYRYFIGDTPDLYRAKPPTQHIVRENCLRCHGVLLRDFPAKETLDCIHCHRQTPHRLQGGSHEKEKQT